MAHHLAVSRWRRLRNASNAWLRRSSPRPVAELDPAYLMLVAALRELPQKQREAIVLHHLVDLPVERVAAETGSSVSAVKKQLTRGRAALSVLLAEVEPAPSGSTNTVGKGAER